MMPNRPLTIRLAVILWAVLLLPLGSVFAQSPCSGLEACLKDLKSEDASKKFAAIFMLGNMKNKKATPVLLELLSRDPDPNMRLSALKAVGALKDPSTVPHLAKYLDSKELRQEAVKALVKIGNKPAVKVLIGGLRKKDVQVAAAQGLGEIADPSAKPALVALLSKTEDPRLRGVSALAIRRINSIWGPSSEEMGVPVYPKSEFIPNASGDWIFVSKDSVSKISAFFQKELKKKPMTFKTFKNRYEGGFGEIQDGVPGNRPGLVFVPLEQEFKGKRYPAKLIIIQENKKETEIKVFRAIGGSD